ncbi:MAG: hypothetical protein A2857_03785 [Candidatus Levybacteria bacterium RIFCSPHIGHO2_01_FULL_36_15]|nr:MAG: hypothetical protein A2857_03785 [Candidatus Levybacteria bacterium RIFCSPHIGHO2_01_FULL_36_15]
MEKIKDCLLLGCSRYVKQFIFFLKKEFPLFISFLNIYIKDKVLFLSGAFENHKNTIVKTILVKRGKRNRIFLHLSAMSILLIGVLISPLISNSNPFSNNKNLLSFAQAQNGEQSLISEDVFQTQESDKPRDKVVVYTVQKGDTISVIARRFGISEDTVRWANDLKTDDITVGDTLDILPVTGIVHKVQRGDNVYAIAKKYATNPQEIVDFPFNDFANPQTFSLVEGQILIVPNGVKPEEKPNYIRPTYIATGPVNVTGEGFTWPIQGVISQSYSWYHKGIDIAAASGAPVVAAQNGTVSAVYTSGWNWGYGIYITIQGNNGYETLYSHMSGANVNVGDTVTAGQSVVGWVGLTGRTTGPHLHLEVKGGSGQVNPLPFLQ